MVAVSTENRPDLQRLVERQIVQRTWGHVRQLHVELVDGQVVVHGRVPSYYCKQLAIQALMEVLEATGSRPVALDIDVLRDPSRRSTS